MPTAWTRCFYRGVVSAAVPAVVVPAGKTWIVTDGDFVVTSTIEGSAGLQDDAGVLFYFVDSAQIARPGAYFAYRGRQAIQAGGSVKVYWGAGTWHVRLTGYELNAV